MGDGCISAFNPLINSEITYLYNGLPLIYADCITTKLVVLCLVNRILLRAPVCFKSHKHSFMPIVEALASKGHQLTVVTILFNPKLNYET